MSVSTWFDYLYHKYIIHKRLQSEWNLWMKFFPVHTLCMSFVFAFGHTVLLWFHLLDIGILTHSCNYLMFTKIKIHPTLKRLFDKFHFDLSARTYSMKLIILITIYWLKKTLKINFSLCYWPLAVTMSASWWNGLMGKQNIFEIFWRDRKREDGKKLPSKLSWCNGLFKYCWQLSER